MTYHPSLKNTIADVALAAAMRGGIVYQSPVEAEPICVGAIVHVLKLYKPSLYGYNDMVRTFVRTRANNLHRTIISSPTPIITLK
jgi:hypothetical protein